MSKKLFEHDISKTLTGMVDYFYKPPDIADSNYDKVDFLVCYRGRFLAIECKQVPNTTCPTSMFTTSQKRVLEDVGKTGIALALVNYGRGTGRDRGLVGVWPIVGRYEWPISFRLDDAKLAMVPIEDGKWPLALMISQMAS